MNCFLHPRVEWSPFHFLTGGRVIWNWLLCEASEKLNTLEWNIGRSSNKRTRNRSELGVGLEGVVTSTYGMDCLPFLYQAWCVLLMVLLEQQLGERTKISRIVRRNRTAGKSILKLDNRNEHSFQAHYSETMYLRFVLVMWNADIIMMLWWKFHKETTETT